MIFYKFFVVLFAINFIILKYVKNHHLESKKFKTVNYLLTIWASINLSAGMSSLFSAVVIYSTLGEKEYMLSLYLIVVGIATICIAFNLFNSLEKIKNTKHSYDITNIFSINNKLT